MYFDQDGLLTREEQLEKIWAERLTPAHRAQCLAEALARGVTYMDLMQEVAAEHDAAMADPVQREKWLRISQEMDERRATPLGRDPVPGKDGER